MARIKPASNPASQPPARRDAAAEHASATHPLARRRARALAIAAIAGGLAWLGHAIWQRVEPLVVARDRYLLSATAITVTPPPEWIVSDVRAQVILSSGLDRRLSLLDDGFVQAIKNAFELHPWVEQVTRVEKSVPAAVHVELVYRRPAAVIESPASDGVALLPVDARGMMLPPEDVPLIRRKYLPRITGIVGQPRAGQRWDDPRVAGAVELAVRLADVWDALHLAEIVPSARPEVQGDRRFFVYDLVTQGGTRIVSGCPAARRNPRRSRLPRQTPTPRRVQSTVRPVRHD